MKRVTVQPVFLPESDLALRREPLVLTRHTDGLPLEAEDLAEYDNRTLLFDVFLRADARVIQALGPPLTHLSDALLPVRARVDGQERPVRTFFVGSKKLFAIEVDVGDSTGVSLELLFGDGPRFSWEGEVRRDAPLPCAKLTLSTLQKNNEQRWIDDWQAYYQRAHGVDQVVLYDNGSQTLPALKALSSGSVVVPWAFPYGPSRSHGNKFTQLGSLNHMRMRFGQRSPVLNFDIDELLVIKSPLVRWLMHRVRALRFDNYKVPYVEPGRDDYSFVDFTQRERSPKGTSYKYSYQPWRTEALAQHRLEKKGGKRALTSIVPARGAYFLHYMGITTNWKVAYWDRKVAALDTAQLVVDRSVVEVLERPSPPSE